MELSNRRYDIDWIRVIAIGLLLLYHVAIAFQPWGIMIGFITTDKPWLSLWTPMTMLNVWRIPLLFFVSGMGVYFAIRNKNWSQLMAERSARILIPFLFGIVAIVPIHILIWQDYYHMKLTYNPNPGHLWFLGNILLYVLIFSPLFLYLKKNEDGKLVTELKKIMRSPLGLLPMFVAFVAEALLIDPRPYEMYAMTWHGFVLGLLAFFFGFCFVLSGEGFGKMILKWKWVFLAAAASLFIYRTVEVKMQASFLLSIESNFWILSVFAFGYKYLNHGGKALAYLSQAAYPVYILHMIFLFLGSKLIFPLDIPLPLQFVLVLLFTLAACMITFELLIRRVKVIGVLFGVKKRNALTSQVPVTDQVSSH